MTLCTFHYGYRLTALSAIQHRRLALSNIGVSAIHHRRLALSNVGAYDPRGERSPKAPSKPGSENCQEIAMEFLMVRPESWGFRSCGRGWLIVWPHPASTEVDSYRGRLQLLPRSRPAVARRPLIADLAAAKDGMGTLLSDMVASCLVRIGSPSLPTPYSIPFSYKQPAIGATRCIVLRLIPRSDGRWPDLQASSEARNRS